MGLVVCGVFAMAIHDTYAKREQAREAAAKQELDDARAAEQEAADRLAHVVLLGQLYGRAPASLGSAFAGIQLGMPQAELDRARPQLDALQSRAALSIETEAPYGVLDALRISTADWSDADLYQQLIRAWGPPVTRDDGAEVWLDPATHHRAMFTPGATLIFARYTPLASWIDGLGPPAWMKLVGSSVDQLRRQPDVAQADQFDDGSLAWTLPPLEDADAPIAIQALTQGNKIIALSIRVVGESATLGALRDGLVAALGAPVPADDDGQDRWPTKPPVTLEVDDDFAQITVGTPSAADPPPPPADPDEP